MKVPNKISDNTKYKSKHNRVLTLKGMNYISDPPQKLSYIDVFIFSLLLDLFNSVFQIPAHFRRGRGSTSSLACTIFCYHRCCIQSVGIYL